MQKEYFWKTIYEMVLIEWRVDDSLGPYLHEEPIIMISSKHCNLDSSNNNSAISNLFCIFSFFLSNQSTRNVQKFVD